jgi:hypothetical protein
VPDVHEREADEGGQQLDDDAVAKLHHWLVDVPGTDVFIFEYVFRTKNLATKSAHLFQILLDVAKSGS